jgi:hypothetical protein
MPSRHEIVVAGRRQTALPSALDFTSRTSPSDGFFMEGDRLSSLEIPDRWISFYGVGLHCCGVWRPDNAGWNIDHNP